MGSYFEARDIGPNERVALLSNNRSIISPLEIDNVIWQLPDVADVANVSVLNNIHGKQVFVDTSRKKVAGYRRMPCWNVAVGFSPISRCRTKLSSATHSPTRSVARWIVTPYQISGRQNTRPHSQAAECLRIRPQLPERQSPRSRPAHRAQPAR